MARFSVSIVAVVITVLVWAEQGHSQVGKRHKCLVIADTLVCPQCPMIAGLLCPRNPPYGSPPWRSCLPAAPTPAPTPEKVENNTILVDIPVDNVKQVYRGYFRPHVHRIARKENEETNDTAEETTTTTTTVETTTELLTTLPKLPFNPKSAAVSSGDGDVILCERNDDCPCPMICCRQGEGCPRRCVRGLRLPPPFK